MSDRGGERRNDTEIRERLVRTETTVRATSERIQVIGDRLHKAENSLTALVLMAEEAKDDRNKLSGKLDQVDEKIGPMIVASAQLATTVAMHVQQCTEHNSNENQRHADNQLRFGRLERSIWIATGAAMALGLVLPYLAKLLKI